MSAHEIRTPRQNLILAALPPDEYERLGPHLQRVELPQAKMLYPDDGTIDYIYFPTNAMILQAHGYVVCLLAALALLGVTAVASAATGFTERDASARWSIPFECPDGSTATDGRLIVETDNFIEAGTTPDPNPPLRVGFTGQCPDGTFSWGFTQPAPTKFAPNLKKKVDCQRHVHRRAGQPGRDHTVSVDALWNPHGPVRTTINAPGSKRKERRANARATDRLRRQHARRRRRQLAVPRAVHPRRHREVARLRQETSKLTKEGAVEQRPVVVRARR